jgi:tetratricopeptide (TPR) repeat protein
LASRLRLPSFTWYTPLWAAVDALHAGRLDEAAALREQVRADGGRAGDRNAELFAEMLRHHERVLTDDWTDLPFAWVEDRIANHPAGFSYRPGYAWALAALGRSGDAAAQLEVVLADDLAGLPFDTNWISAFGEIGECALLLRHEDAARAVLRHLTPYATQQLAAGRAVITYGCGHRQLGHACAILGRDEEAAAHYAAAIRIDGGAGLLTLAERAQVALDRLRPAPAR